MDTRKIAKEYRMNQWAEIIKARNESGKNVKEFCEETGISRYAYFYWQRKLREEACNNLTKTEEASMNAPAGWLKLNPGKSQIKDDNIMVEINGCQIIVKGNTDFELLKNICGVLRSL